MKNITLLVAGLLLTGSLASATETINVTVAAYHTPVDYRNAEPVIFMERGIEFMVFPNGEIDFNTQPATTGSSYYRTAAPGGRRNETFGAAAANGGVRVEHDANGKVRRVGNVYINYDYDGRVKRIGSVYMSYNRFALAQIGMLSIIYDRNGRIIDTRGYVNAASRSYAYDPCGSAGYDYGNAYNPGCNTGNSGYQDDGYSNGGSSSMYYRKAANNNENNTAGRSATQNNK
jgi:hypothetical protein